MAEKLTKAQRALLEALAEEPEMTAECAAELEWRSARALDARGLVRITSDAPEKIAVGHWFEAIITPAGLSALKDSSND